MKNFYGCQQYDIAEIVSAVSKTLRKLLQKVPAHDPVYTYCKNLKRSIWYGCVKLLVFILMDILTDNKNFTYCLPFNVAINDVL
jgi:hypothetical protein